MVEPELGLETQLETELVYSNKHTVTNNQRENIIFLIQMVSSECEQRINTDLYMRIEIC